MSLPGGCRIPVNTGFDGRMFLTKEEWTTFCKRKPVRYIRKGRAATCSICGGDEQSENPFQHAHRIGFEIGVIYLGLTPDTAHRRTCNQKAELDLPASIALIQSKSVVDLPDYLPAAIHGLWQHIAARDSNRPHDS
jgi:hypothetical protein